jgi:hypothetical protein
MRTRGRTDANHAVIVQALEQLGCSVLSLANLGNGAPDLLVARAGRMYLMELKDGSKPPSKRQLTPDERAFHLAWQGRIDVVETVGAAIRVVTW